MRRLVLLEVLLAAVFSQEEGKIIRPQDGSALPSGEISVIATARAGKLELDGSAVQAEELFPDVFRARLTPSPGKHSLALSWVGGRQEIRFFVGENPPAEFKAFRVHPPTAVDCTHCHGISSRGRFRFVGGCLSCHQQEAFVNVHKHAPNILEQCGQCHNAHGSTAKALLTISREKACKLCHN